MSVPRSSDRRYRHTLPLTGTDLRLCRFFGLSDGYWLRVQAAYDTDLARMRMGDELDKIKPWSQLATA